MDQPDLLQRIERQALEADRRCGACEVWNALPGAQAGGCSVHGERAADAPPCERWFSCWELGRPLYGARR